MMQSLRDSILCNLDLLLDLNKVTFILDENTILRDARTRFKCLHYNISNIRDLLFQLNSFLEDYVAMHTGKTNSQYSVD